MQDEHRETDFEKAPAHRLEGEGGHGVRGNLRQCPLRDDHTLVHPSPVQTAVLAVFATPESPTLGTEHLHTEQEQSVFARHFSNTDCFVKPAITKDDLWDLTQLHRPWCLHFGGHGQLGEFGPAYLVRLRGKFPTISSRVPPPPPPPPPPPLQDTLAFHPSAAQLLREPSQPVELVTKEAFVKLLLPFAAPRGPLELVVLNSCSGEGLAQALSREARVRYVVYWACDVPNANCVKFCSVFYGEIQVRCRVGASPVTKSQSRVGSDMYKIGWGALEETGTHAGRNTVQTRVYPRGP